MYEYMHKILVHAQDSCACITLLCMRNTLVHALGQGAQGPGTKPGTQKERSPGLGPAQRSGPGLPAHICKAETSHAVKLSGYIKAIRR